jgi:hypothetical protein
MKHKDFCPKCGEMKTGHRLYGAPWCPVEPRPLKPGLKRFLLRCWNEFRKGGGH